MPANELQRGHAQLISLKLADLALWRTRGLPGQGQDNQHCTWPLTALPFLRTTLTKTPDEKAVEVCIHYYNTHTHTHTHTHQDTLAKPS